MPKYKIVVREIASKDNVYTEDYEGEKYEVERRAGHIWNSPYASVPDRYRLYVFEKGQKKQFMTIG